MFRKLSVLVADLIDTHIFFFCEIVVTRLWISRKEYESIQDFLETNKTSEARKQRGSGELTGMISR